MTLVTGGLLTEAELTHLVNTLAWRFDCELFDNSDSVTITGDGVDDIDQLIGIIDRHRKIRMLVNVGFITPDYKVANRVDIVNMRAVYVSIYGEVNNPAPPNALNIPDPW